MRRRFFVERFESKAAVLRGDAAEHLGRVLRAEPGQLYELSDGQLVWLARVERVTLSKRGDNRIDFALVEPVPTREMGFQIDLLISLVKFDRFEWCLEKATELGAHTIIPLAAARTDKPLIAASDKRQARWQRIVLESAQQSRRLRPPALLAAARPETALAQSSSAFKILLSERPDAPGMRDVIARVFDRGLSSHKMSAPIRLASTPDSNRLASAALAIGPEGGWTDDEIAAARAAGFAEASLGGDVLRTETAVLASMAILRYALAD
jgi:16S rRNA (uracil1498-N3)-methyltransferase